MFSRITEFLDTIGKEALKVAMETFHKSCSEKNIQFPDSRDGASDFLDKFLEDFNNDFFYHALLNYY